jgi:ankyrin repeat protein
MPAGAIGSPGFRPVPGLQPPQVRSTPPGNSQKMPPNIQSLPEKKDISELGTFADSALSIGKKITQSSATYKKSISQNDLARLLNHPIGKKFEILNLINSMTREQLNHGTKNGDSALLLALSTNADPEIITALAKKCDVNTSLTALMRAINENYNEDAILALIDVMTPDQLSQVTNDNSALNYALFNGRLNIVKALAEKSNVNTPLNHEKDTALMFAIFFSDSDHYPVNAILSLIEAMKPEDLKYVTKRGDSALLLALYKNADPEIIQALAKKCDVNTSLTALMRAINENYNEDAILALIDVMTPDQLSQVTNGNSALLLALSTNAHPKIITALANKCDVNHSLNDNNDTALLSAIYNGRNKDGILALIKAMTKGQLNHVTTNGNSALRIALYKDADPEIITALAKKCDVNHSLNPNNDTALTLAIFNKYPIDGILALIEAMEPEELNHVTTQGNSALRLALKRLPVDQLVRFLYAYSKKQEDTLKTAFLCIFITFTIPKIIDGLRTVKKRLDIPRIEALYNQYLQIDDAEQKKEKLTQLLKTITDKNMEPLVGELARLIKLQLALLKHEDLRDQDIQGYFNKLMDEDLDQNGDFTDIVDLCRIPEGVEFFINPDKDRPFGEVVSVDSAQKFRQMHPSGFRTLERAAAYIFTYTNDADSMVKTTIEELDRLSRPPG